VYSLGCVVYEMIWGRPPFTGAPAIVFLRHTSAEPIPLSCRLPSIPHGVSAAVSRALAKAPASRFGTAGAFAAAIRAGCHPLESCRPIEVRRDESSVQRPTYTPMRDCQAASAS
jgi:serine/threonine protein kinase